MKKSVEKHRKKLDVKRDFLVTIDNLSDERIIARHSNSRMKELCEYEAFS